MRLCAAICAFILVLGGCGKDPEPTDEAGTKQEPLYVYSAYDDVEYLPALFREYTEATGIVVVVRHRDDKQNLDDMMAKSGSQPADLLLTSSIASIWKAAEEGLLRPLPVDSDAMKIPGAFRDPDGLWTAASLDPMVVLRQAESDAEVGYPSLGQAVAPLCVSSSALPANRTLLAWMIAATDTRTTEYSVRRWMAALQLPPREDYNDVVDALDNDACGEALLPLSAVSDERRSDVLAPPEVFFDIEGIGIGRHARSPDAAAALIDWFVSRSVQQKHAQATGRLPVTDPDEALPDGSRLSTRGIAAAGFHYPDAVLLAERARYR